MTSTKKLILWFTAVSAVAVVLTAVLCTPHQPKATIIIQQVYYGSVIGVGMVTDKQAIEEILQCVDNLEYYNDNRNNVDGGGGLEVTVFQGETIRLFTFLESGLVKDLQDPEVFNWYRPSADMYDYLEKLIQEKYPTPEW